MKQSFLKLTTAFVLAFNLANADGFFDISGGTNSMKIKNTDVKKNSPSLTVGLGAKIKNDNFFVLTGGEISSNFAKYSAFNVEYKNLLSSFLYFGFGTEINEKFSIYAKGGLALEVLKFQESAQGFGFNIQIEKTFTFIGFGAGVGAAYKISQNSAASLEYLIKNTENDDNLITKKLTNQVIKISYRMFF
jgi:opacity protein-like surface antigen